MPEILYVCKSKCPDVNREEIKAQKGKATQTKGHKARSGQTKAMGTVLIQLLKSTRLYKIFVFL